MACSIRLATRAAILGLALVATGCTHQPLRPEGRDVAWVWGNFCGKGYPALAPGTLAEQREALLGIVPADTIDAACRDHDLCYLERGDHHKRCDDALIRTMYRMRFDGPERRACARLADQIGRFFACAMPSTGEGFDAIAGALKPLTGMDPLCPGFTHADFLGALRAAPAPGSCTTTP